MVDHRNYGVRFGELRLSVAVSKAVTKYSIHAAEKVSHRLAFMLGEILDYVRLLAKNRIDEFRTIEVS